MNQINRKNILITVLIAIILGIQYEYLGWRIAEIHIDGVVFPGLLDLKVIVGGLKTAASALFFGFFILLISLIFPRFRLGYPKNAHKPIILGVIFIYLMMGVAIVQGFLT